MRVKIYKLEDIKKRDIKFYELEKIKNDDGTSRLEFVKYSFNKEILNDENVEFFKNCNKELIVSDDPNYDGPIVISNNSKKSTPIHYEPNPRKTYLAVFLHKNWNKKPKENYIFTDEAYIDKYYCPRTCTMMHYPAEMIYSRGKDWVVESPEYFKVSKEETEEAFLIDLD